MFALLGHRLAHPPRHEPAVIFVPRVTAPGRSPRSIRGLRTSSPWIFVGVGTGVRYRSDTDEPAAYFRTLKPELWQDEKIGNLSRDARLLFIGLVTMADDEGRLRALPALILGHVFPYDTDALRKLEQWLEEIAHSGLIVRYSVGGTPYVELRGWRKHQTMNKMTPSDLPAPERVTDTNGRVTEQVAVPFRRRRSRSESVRGC